MHAATNARATVIFCRQRARARLLLGDYQRHATGPAMRLEDQPRRGSGWETMLRNLATDALVAEAVLYASGGRRRLIVEHGQPLTEQAAALVQQFVDDVDQAAGCSLERGGSGPGIPASTSSTRRTTSFAAGNPAWPSAAPCVSSFTNNDSRSVRCIARPRACHRQDDHARYRRLLVRGARGQGLERRTASNGGVASRRDPRLDEAAGRLDALQALPDGGVVGPHLLYAHVVAEHRPGPVSQAPGRHEGRHSAGRPPPGTCPAPSL